MKTCMTTTQFPSFIPNVHSTQQNKHAQSQQIIFNNTNNRFVQKVQFSFTHLQIRRFRNWENGKIRHCNTTYTVTKKIHTKNEAPKKVRISRVKVKFRTFRASGKPSIVSQSSIPMPHPIGIPKNTILQHDSRNSYFSC